jgi:hypothetical protein
LSGVIRESRGSRRGPAAAIAAADRPWRDLVAVARGEFTDIAQAKQIVEDAATVEVLEPESFLGNLRRTLAR